MKKQKQKMPDGRRATCPRWDRWHIRTPNSEDQQKLIRLYRKSGAKTKSDFVRARLLGETFKVITEDPSKELYLEKLSKNVALTHKIGMLYNEAVKALNTYHSVATAQRMLDKLETYSQVLIRLQHQAIILTIRIQAKEATK
ncbi:plasmid mobilization protein [Prevotella intermedia]|uniref:plasmid mobilization protein n=1 Tax=Prevotella intermedia TaxID=28131 RepID=UPI00397A6885